VSVRVDSGRFSQVDFDYDYDDYDDYDYCDYCDYCERGGCLGLIPVSWRPLSNHWDKYFAPVNFGPSNGDGKLSATRHRLTDPRGDMTRPSLVASNEFNKVLF